MYKLLHKQECGDDGCQKGVQKKHLPTPHNERHGQKNNKYSSIFLPNYLTTRASKLASSNAPWAASRHSVALNNACAGGLSLQSCAMIRGKNYARQLELNTELVCILSRRVQLSIYANVVVRTIKSARLGF